MQKLREILTAMRIRSLRSRRLDLGDVIDMDEKQKERIDKRIAECEREIETIDRRLKELQPPPRGATRISQTIRLTTAEGQK